jgi:hypothetical protein
VLGGIVLCGIVLCGIVLGGKAAAGFAASASSARVCSVYVKRKRETGLVAMAAIKAKESGSASATSTAQIVAC